MDRGDDIQERLAALEAHQHHQEKAMDALAPKVDTVIQKLDKLPTAAGLWGMVATMIGVSLGMVGAVIGVIALFR